MAGGGGNLGEEVLEPSEADPQGFIGEAWAGGGGEVSVGGLCRLLFLQQVAHGAEAAVEGLRLADGPEDAFDAADLVGKVVEMIKGGREIKHGVSEGEGGVGAAGGEV